MLKTNISSNPFRQRDSTAAIQPLVLADNLTHSFELNSHAKLQSAIAHSRTTDHLENLTKTTKDSLPSQSPNLKFIVEEPGDEMSEKTNTLSSQKKNVNIQYSKTDATGFEVNDLKMAPKTYNNPFAKKPDLASHQEDQPQYPVQQNDFGLEDLPLDVDGFKRLLLTGDSSLRSTSHNPFVRSQSADHQFENETSLLNKSPVCRQLVPTNSTKNIHESKKSESSLETEDHQIDFDLGIRPPTEKLAPSKTRYPKLIKMELKDDAPLNKSQYSSSIALDHQFPIPMTPTNSYLNPYQKNTVKLDLNKPLPPAPTTSFESDNKLVHSRKQAKRSISTPFYSTSSFRKMPPSPSSIRRNSQLIQSMATGTSDFSSDKILLNLTPGVSPKSTVLPPNQNITSYEGKRRSFSKSMSERDSKLPLMRRQTSHWNFVHYSRPNLRSTMNRSFTG